MEEGITTIDSYNDAFSRQPDCILEYIFSLLLEQRNARRFSSAFGHLNLEGQRYGSELCFVVALSIKSTVHKREFCPLAHTLKQAEANQSRCALPPMKNLGDLRAVSRRFYNIINRIVWVLDPAAVMKQYIGYLVQREELPASLACQDEEILSVRRKRKLGPSSTNTDDQERLPYVMVCGNDHVDHLAQLTDAVWEINVKFKIMRVLNELVVWCNKEGSFELPHVKLEFQRFINNLRVTAIDKKEERFMISTGDLKMEIGFRMEADSVAIGRAFVGKASGEYEQLDFVQDGSLKEGAFEKLRALMGTCFDETELILFFLALTREIELAQRLYKTRVESGSHNLCRIRVHRNRVELPPKQIEMDSSATLEMLLKKVVEAVEGEDPNCVQHYRFRKISHRKNHTKRPSTVYEQSEYGQTLEVLNLRKKQHIYLEQDTYSDFRGLATFDPNPQANTDKILISVRLWNGVLKKPTSVKDFKVAQTITLKQLKAHCSPLVRIPVERMVAVEEETERQIHLLLEDDKQLGEYGIVTGDIIHIEELNKDHLDEDGKVVRSLTQQYFVQQRCEHKLQFPEIFGDMPHSNFEEVIRKITDYFTSTFEDERQKNTSSFHFLCFEILSYLVKVFHRIKTIACLKARDCTIEERVEQVRLLANTKFEHIWHEACTRVSVKRIARIAETEERGKQENREEPEEVGQPEAGYRKRRRSALDAGEGDEDPATKRLRNNEGNATDVGNSLLELSQSAPLSVPDDVAASVATPTDSAAASLVGSVSEVTDGDLAYVKYERDGNFRLSNCKLHHFGPQLDAGGWGQLAAFLGTKLDGEQLRLFFQDLLCESNRIDAFAKLKDVYNESIWNLYPYGDHTQFKYSPNL
eukprot:TRINITY_DN3018_c0_g1_i2.p1 TRINITY_DN3018_c0_g1~~TRINITY_DN3018_c0_g1_i2.p1  ORF type:complete len:868 (-),score=243.63 TRINITY_DN3018_c0_g1_i2:70-2673(-)